MTTDAQAKWLKGLFFRCERRSLSL